MYLVLAKNENEKKKERGRERESSLWLRSEVTLYRASPEEKQGSHFRGRVNGRLRFKGEALVVDSDRLILCVLLHIYLRHK